MRRIFVSSTFVVALALLLGGGGALALASGHSAGTSPAAATATAVSAVPASQILLVRRSTWQKPAHVYSIAADGSDMRRLTPLGSNDFGATWSPDHTSIAYIHRSHGVTSLWRMNADGTGRRRIAYSGPSLTNVSEALAWSPDGRSIAGGCRLSKKNAYRIAITVLDLATGKSRTVATITWSMTVTSLDWSPDSSRLLYCTMSADPYLFTILDLATGENTTLDTGGYHAAWSPDGAHLLLSAFMDGSTGLWPPYQYQIELRDADGSYVTTLFGADFTGGCAFSPDGSLCAYTSGTNHRDRLFVQPADGSGDPQVVRTWKTGGTINLVWK